MSALVHYYREGESTPACPEPGERAERRWVEKDAWGEDVIFLDAQFWLTCHADEVTCGACFAIALEEARVKKERAAAEVAAPPEDTP